jgi:hypothetical protein
MPSNPTVGRQLRGFPVDVGGFAEFASYEFFRMVLGVADGCEDFGATQESQHMGGNDTGWREDHRSVGLGSDQVSFVGTVADLGQVDPAPVVELDEYVLVSRAHETSVPPWGRT